MNSHASVESTESPSEEYEMDNSNGDARTSLNDEETPISFLSGAPLDSSGCQEVPAGMGGAQRNSTWRTAQISNNSSSICPPSPNVRSNYIQHRTSKRFHLESTTSEVETDPEIQLEQKKRLEAINRRERKSARNLTRTWHITSFPILLVSFMIFLVLAASGIAVGFITQSARDDEIRTDAMALAVETGQFFSNRLDQAILPLFSMAQFATNLQTFKDLPAKIGVTGAPGSLPYDPETHKRNITGVCDDPELMTTFVEIASNIKRKAGMDGILSNIQLAPNGVICLLHPMNNTDDFDAGAFLDNTPVWGLDILHDPGMSFIATQTIQREEVGIAGPLVLKQCPTCDLFFVARLPVVYEGYQMNVNGVAYDRWGFATALISWTTLVEESGMDELFSRNGFRYRLTRTDRVLNKDTLQIDETVVVLAETSGYREDEKGWKTVSNLLETTDNEWCMTVAYDYATTWKRTWWVIGACVAIALCISVLVHMVLSQKHVQADMQAESSAQEAKVNTERNMTAYFAHELRNPLSALDSALNSIEKEGLPPSTTELLDSMQLCSSFMSSIMNNLLDVRKIEEGKMRIRSRPFSLCHLVDDSKKMMNSSVRKGVRLMTRKELSPEREWVLGDAHRIQQVLTNVLTNAIKYTLEGSITVAVSWQDSFVVLECIDTGPGIPKSEQERLFERFVQRGGAPGTGLGLNIAKQIVNMMHGTIWFESDPTVKPGTTCRIRLPLLLSEQHEEPTKKPVDVSPIEDPLRILIVDDIKMNRTMLSRRIKKGIAPNAEVITAETGEKALEICHYNGEANESTETAAIDIIICDQFMEEAGGVLLGTDTIIALRRNKIDALIIGCSGNDLDASFYEAGADIVWGKPMPPNSEIIEQFQDGLLTKRIERISRRRLVVED